MRSVLFWDITQHTVIIPYRRFGTIFAPIRSLSNLRPWRRASSP